MPENKEVILFTSLQPAIDALETATQNSLQATQDANDAADLANAAAETYTLIRFSSGTR
jgi:hypothetical protein